MFHGVAVDGSTSFVAGESVDEEEEEEEPHEDPDVQTPISITSHKRASITSTTGSSPRKLPKSPAVRSMNKFMSENARIQAERNVMFQKYLENKQQNAQQSVVKLAADIIKPVDPEFRTIYPRLRNRWHSYTMCGAN